MSQQKRKNDAHQKIMMGGLIVKAGLEYLHEDDKDILLGLLIDAKQKIQSDDKETIITHYKKLGNDAFNTTP